MTKPTLNEFLEDHQDRAVSIRRRCMTCQDFPELDAEIRDFVALRKDGKTRVSFQYFYNNFVAKHYNISFGAVRNHARKCCGMESR